MLEKIAQKAIQAALDQNWEEALRLNEEILARSPQDISALNRLALAQSKLGKKSQAKETLQKTLKIDPSNPIATKKMANLKFPLKAPIKTGESLSPVRLFLQEPGKTKMVELLNVADSKTLATVAPGEKLSLVPRRKSLVLKKDGLCLGSLPEDLSFRLFSLIKKGNRYEAIVVRVTPKKVLVLIREVFRSTKMQGMPSFF